MSLTLRGPAGDIRVDDGDGGEPRLARTHSDAWGIATLEHEWSLRDDLDASLALRPLTLVREGEAVTLTVADPGGRSLADLLGAPWEVAASLRVAIGLATALVRLHARGLAHNDVRAGNVWTNAATGECWLTGFGAAARLGAVVSDRSIDVRCDLRGCGSLLHELLVGSPSQTAERDHERTTALERIVARLSERDGAGYATAGQLLADLRRCAAARQRHGRIEPSRVDVDDAPDAFARPGADELLAIIDAVPGLVWRARAEGAIDFSSRGWRGYAGKGDAELHGWAWAMSDLIHPLDRAALVEAWARLLASGEEGRLEARLRRFDGHYRWFQIHAVPLLDARGEVATWWGLGSDIEEEKQARAGAAGEQRLLAMIVRGEPTSAILEGVVRLVESSASGLRASILLLDPETATMRHAAAVSLPRSYVERIDGTPIGPAAFACGTAAWRREPVFVTDIATDPLGALFREHALAHGLRACWSIPLLATDGRVLGAFGIYAGEPRGPGPFELELLERCARVTSIAIERSQSDEALKRSEAYRIEAERLSRTGSFGFDLRRPRVQLLRGHQRDRRPAALAPADLRPGGRAGPPRRSRAHRRPRAADAALGRRLRPPGEDHLVLRRQLHLADHRLHPRHRVAERQAVEVGPQLDLADPPQSIDLRRPALALELRQRLEADKPAARLDRQAAQRVDVAPVLRPQAQPQVVLLGRPRGSSRSARRRPSSAAPPRSRRRAPRGRRRGRGRS
ncbi:GAF domain-containing protein [Nannocystis sp. ILAH1]|uniref:GAF domain-containing protein n=1 Tax=Nannocystis sp. ILAH1 TaxID=2996789 RepID=UPI0022701074|nr:GAF domain-containing protein [Nannocystis sp. ILAH1]MCY0991650.1 GAF domain-containing protein [Nannocystis sp. ILAH1]